MDMVIHDLEFVEEPLVGDAAFVHQFRQSLADLSLQDVLTVFWDEHNVVG